ncbi:hypothetical protein FW796_28160 [Pseudomonas sp. 910_21]
MEDLIIVVLPVCPVQAQSTLGFQRFTRGVAQIGMTGLTSGFALWIMRCERCWSPLVARPARGAWVGSLVFHRHKKARH